VKYVKCFRKEKNVCVEVELHNCRVIDVKIFGDFFVYPEDAIEKLENALRMCSTKECIEKAIESISRYSTPLGFSWSDLVEALASIVEECSERG